LSAEPVNPRVRCVGRLLEPGEMPSVASQCWLTWPFRWVEYWSHPNDLLAFRADYDDMQTDVLTRTEYIRQYRRRILRMQVRTPPAPTLLTRLPAALSPYNDLFDTNRMNAELGGRFDSRRRFASPIPLTRLQGGSVGVVPSAESIFCRQTLSVRFASFTSLNAHAWG
jgi:hypothetical protein